LQVFDAIPKHCGNSIGTTISQDIIEKVHISTKKKSKFIALGTEMDNLKRAFGSLKLKKSTQKVMEEIDKGYD